MCIYRKYKPKKKAKVAVGLNSPTATCCPKPKNSSFCVYPDPPKKKRCPQDDVVLGPLRDKKRPSGLLTPAGLHNGRSPAFRHCKLSTRPHTLSPPSSHSWASRCGCSLVTWRRRRRLNAAKTEQEKGIQKPLILIMRTGIISINYRMNCCWRSWVESVPARSQRDVSASLNGGWI